MDYAIIINELNIYHSINNICLSQEEPGMIAGLIVLVIQLPYVQCLALDLNYCYLQ